MECEMIGKRVTVFDRYLFAVPVKGKIVKVSATDGAYSVDFFSDNPGGKNVTKFNGTFFHKEQCQIDEEESMSIDRLGLLPNERKTHAKLMEAMDAFMSLPVQHPSEPKEMEFAIHQLQGLLAVRIARRVYPEGWPTFD